MIVAALVIAYALIACVVAFLAQRDIYRNGTTHGVIIERTEHVGNRRYAVLVGTLWGIGWPFALFVVIVAGFFMALDKFIEDGEPK